jgi:hypothetical protein
LRKIECLRVKWESTGRPVFDGGKTSKKGERIETIEDISIL